MDNRNNNPTTFNKENPPALQIEELRPSVLLDSAFLQEMAMDIFHQAEELTDDDFILLRKKIIENMAVYEDDETKEIDSYWSAKFASRDNGNNGGINYEKELEEIVKEFPKNVGSIIRNIYVFITHHVRTNYESRESSGKKEKWGSDRGITIGEIQSFLPNDPSLLTLQGQAKLKALYTCFDAPYGSGTPFAVATILDSIMTFTSAIEAQREMQLNVNSLSIVRDADKKLEDKILETINQKTQAFLILEREQGRLKIKRPDHSPVAQMTQTSAVNIIESSSETDNEERYSSEESSGDDSSADASDHFIKKQNPAEKSTDNKLSIFNTTEIKITINELEKIVEKISATIQNIFLMEEQTSNKKHISSKKGIFDFDKVLETDYEYHDDMEDDCSDFHPVKKSATNINEIKIEQRELEITLLKSELQALLFKFDIDYAKTVPSMSDEDLSRFLKIIDDSQKRISFLLENNIEDYNFFEYLAGYQNDLTERYRLIKNQLLRTKKFLYTYVETKKESYFTNEGDDFIQEDFSDDEIAERMLPLSEERSRPKTEAESAIDRIMTFWSNIKPNILAPLENFSPAHLHEIIKKETELTELKIELDNDISRVEDIFAKHPGDISTVIEFLNDLKLALKNSIIIVHNNAIKEIKERTLANKKIESMLDSCDKKLSFLDNQLDLNINKMHEILPIITLLEAENQKAALEELKKYLEKNQKIQTQLKELQKNVGDVHLSISCLNADYAHFSAFLQIDSEDFNKYTNEVSRKLSEVASNVQHTLHDAVQNYNEAEKVFLFVNSKVQYQQKQQVIQAEIKKQEEENTLSRNESDFTQFRKIFNHRIECAKDFQKSYQPLSKRIDQTTLEIKEQMASPESSLLINNHLSWTERKQFLQDQLTNLTKTRDKVRKMQSEFSGLEYQFNTDFHTTLFQEITKINRGRAENDKFFPTKDLFEKINAQEQGVTNAKKMTTEYKQKLAKMDADICSSIEKLKSTYQAEFDKNKPYRENLDKISNIINDRVKKRLEAKKKVTNNALGEIQEKKEFYNFISQIINSKNYQSLSRHGEKHLQKETIIYCYLNAIKNAKNIKELLRAIIAPENEKQLRKNLGRGFYKLFNKEHSTTDKYINLLTSDVIKLIRETPALNNKYGHELDEIISKSSLSKKKP